MKEPNNIALVTTDLRIGYGDIHVLEQLNLELHCGELVCLMGQNGTGKSTLLRTISGIQKSISGQITIGNLHLAIGILHFLFHATSRSGVESDFVNSGRPVRPEIQSSSRAYSWSIAT